LSHEPAIDGADADGGKELIFAGVHALGLGAGAIVVALDVEEGVEGVEEKLMFHGVAEFLGAAAGFIEADDGVEVD